MAAMTIIGCQAKAIWQVTDEARSSAEYSSAFPETES